MEQGNDPLSRSQQIDRNAVGHSDEEQESGVGGSVAVHPIQ
jgi:hypothetical protein